MLDCRTSVRRIAVFGQFETFTPWPESQRSNARELLLTAAAERWRRQLGEGASSNVFMAMVADEQIPLPRIFAALCNH